VDRSTANNIRVNLWGYNGPKNMGISSIDPNRGGRCVVFDGLLYKGRSTRIDWPGIKGLNHILGRFHWSDDVLS